MSIRQSSLASLIEGCGLSLTPAQYDQLWAYHGMLRAANVELNLTRIHNFENMVLKHYVDSLLVLKFEELPSPLMDMGSGAGPAGNPAQDRTAGRGDDPRRAEGGEGGVLERGLR